MCWGCFRDVLGMFWSCFRDVLGICLEICWCSGLSASVTRTMVMEEYKIQTDLVDRNFLRVNSCVQRTSLALTCIFAPLGEIFYGISNCFYVSIMACVAAQIVDTLRHRNAWPNRPVPMNIVREKSRKKRKSKSSK